MKVSSSAVEHNTAQPGARVSTDRRRHRRVAIPLLGRFMRANRHEYPCKLNDVSVGGAALMSPVVVGNGEKIVVYLDHLGGLEGHVVRVFDGGFALKFAITAHKREKLAAQLTWLLNRDVMAALDQRRHERFVLGDKTVAVRLSDEITQQCRLLDVSLSGASVATEVRPLIGTEVLIGKLRGRVMRHHDHGIGVEFIDIQEPEALRKHFL